MFRKLLKIATADALKTEPFIYIWTIENVPKLISVTLKSPLFATSSDSKVKWCLRIDLLSLFHVVCWLIPEGGSPKPPPADTIEFSFLDANGEPLLTRRNEKNDFLVFMLSKEAFLERYEEFLPNNTLTIKCRIWIKGIFLPNEDLKICRVKTRLNTYSRSFLWPIKEFSSLKCSTAQDFSKLALDERKVYSLKPFSANGPFLAWILFLKQHAGSEYIHVDFLIDKGENYAFGCEVSVLDSNRNAIASRNNTCRAPFSSTFIEFRKLISKNTLMSTKELFLRHDTLFLRCFFVVYSGVMSNEIEYCTPNVFSVIKDEIKVSNRTEVLEIDSNYSLQFAKYFTKTSDDIDFSGNSDELKCDSQSCRDACKLRIPLRQLRNEATLSDISLKIGKNLYPVHRNILCSRYPVFENIIDKNIIEMTDINEDTLHHLLKYIYTEEVDLQFENAFHLYKAASDYQLFDLKDKCSDILIMNLNQTNVRDILFLAKKYHDEKLETAVIENNLRI